MNSPSLSLPLGGDEHLDHWLVMSADEVFRPEAPRRPWTDCPVCREPSEIVYYYPNKTVMLKCGHIVPLPALEPTKG